MKSAARIPPGVHGVNVVHEEGPVGGTPEPGGLPAASAACVCGEINTRHCPVHGNLEPTHDWFSVQAAFWRTLWLVVRGGRLREWKHLPVGSIEDLLDEDGFLIGGRLHIPRETFTPSGEPGFGGSSRSLCGKFEGIVYSAELARFHYPDLSVCLWCEGRASRGA